VFRGRPIRIIATLNCFRLDFVFFDDDTRGRWTAIDSLLARRVVNDEEHRDDVTMTDGRPAS